VSRLVLVPTPIGALNDITLHALEVLRSADVVACEDTRRSGKLLARHGVSARLERLDAHTVEARGPALLDAHATLAYLSDAGTPGISDPGADLVRLALAAGHDVEVLPGPTAFVPALILSGLPVARFAFEGFLPRKGTERKRRLAALARRDHATALYEAPGRVAGTLADLAEACGGDRPASVSRELSKLHEETARGDLETLAAQAAERPARGEHVVVIGPAPEPEAEDARSHAHDTAAALRGAGLEGRTLRDALQALGVPRNEAYRLALDTPGDP
jgi:16S rRNA (cytidine1402-2'-O)-methyltransferase